MKFTYGDRSWNLHRLILCQNSDWFKKACTSEFKEAKDGVAVIEPMKGKTTDDIEQMLKSMYTYDYDFGVLRVRSTVDDKLFALNTNCFSLNVEMYYLADYFQIQSLKEEAMRKWKLSAVILWNLLTIGHLLQERKDLDTIIENMIQAMHLAYGSRWSPQMRDLREAIGISMHRHLGTLQNRASFSEMVRECPALIGDIILAQWDHPRIEEGSHCAGCGLFAEEIENREGYVSLTCKSCLEKPSFRD